MTNVIADDGGYGGDGDDDDDDDRLERGAANATSPNDVGRVLGSDWISTLIITQSPAAKKTTESLLYSPPSILPSFFSSPPFLYLCRLQFTVGIWLRLYSLALRRRLAMLLAMFTPAEEVVLAQVGGYDAMVLEENSQ